MEQRKRRKTVEINSTLPILSPPSLPSRLSAINGFHSRNHSVIKHSLVEEVPIELPSVWKYLKNELRSADFDDAYAMKRERVANFLSVPWQVEKVYSIFIVS